MARRIALTMLSLVGALLLGAVVPLGLITTARERASFRQDTVLTARALAATAEDGLTEPGHSTAIASPSKITIMLTTIMISSRVKPDWLVRFLISI